MTFGFPKVKWLQYKVRWANVQAIDVKFSQDFTPKIIKNRLIFDKSYWKNKRGRFLGHSVYT